VFHILKNFHSLTLQHILLRCLWILDI